MSPGRRGRALVAAGLALAAAVPAACGDDGGGDAVTVFAAASLTDAFEELGAAFEAAHPGVTVRFAFAGSSSLREQLLDGAPADVFAPADTAIIQQAVDAGVVGPPVDLARNELQIVVPAGNPGGVATPADLAEADLLVGLCAAAVPCGRFAREALDRAGVTPAVDTEEPDVRSLLTKVAAGELDVGIVYRTDVLSAGDAVEGIDIPAEHRVTAVYPIAVTTTSRHRAQAEAFVDFARTDEGRAILAAHGFLT